MKAQIKSSPISGSRLFQPYRALGCCSSHVPLKIRSSTVRNEHYVLTAVGRSVHTYNVPLILLFLLKTLLINMNFFLFTDEPSWH